jgi:hypothetical protein
VEEPFPGCDTNIDHQDRCLFDVLILMDRLSIMECRDQQVIDWWVGRRPGIHDCHVLAAMRQLVSFQRALDIVPGEPTEHVVCMQVDVHMDGLQL